MAKKKARKRPVAKGTRRKKTAPKKGRAKRARPKARRRITARPAQTSVIDKIKTVFDDAGAKIKSLLPGEPETSAPEPDRPPGEIK